MKRNRCLLCLALPALLTFGIPSPLRAETKTSEKSIWGAFEMGGINVKEPTHDMFHLRFAMSYARWSHTFFTTAAASNVDMHEESLISDHVVQKEKIAEYTLMIGQRVVGRVGYASASAGLAITHRTVPYRSDQNRTALGLPLDAQVVLTPSRYFGIGLRGFVNLNSDRSYSGASMGFYVGQIW